MIQKIRISSIFLQKALADLTRCGFGIYLIHYFFVGFCYSFTEWIELPVAFRIPVAGILTFSIAWAVVRIIYCVPKTAKWIVG